MANSSTILAINTASLRTGIAILAVKNVARNKIGGLKKPQLLVRVAPALLAQKSWQSNSNEAEKLMPSIKQLLSRSGKKFSDIKEVYVVKGPGSFTGLRVGVTVANTIAYLNDCKLFGIDTFEYWRSAIDWRLATDGRSTTDGRSVTDVRSSIDISIPGNVLPKSSPNSPALLIYAGSGGVYLYENPTNSKNPKITLVPLKDLNQTLKSKGIKEVFGDITQEQKSIFKSIKFIEMHKSFGEIISAAIAKISTQKMKPLKSKSTQSKSIQLVEPLYIKNPNISVSKKILCYT